MGKEEKSAALGEENPKVPWLTSSRVGLAVVGFLGFVNLYCLRVNMSVAMVCMVNHTAISTETSINDTADVGPADSQCSAENSTSSSSSDDGEFAWSKEQQGIILGAFFWGYLVTQIPGGWMAQRFGGKRVFGYSMLVTAIATLLTPVGAHASPYALVALRVLKGLGEGVVFPAMHTLWSKWAPPLERSILIGFTYAGAQIGNVITFPISGLLCGSGFLGGWPAIFYVFGTFGVIWFILWMVIAYDSPSQHPRIKPVERDYIEDSIGSTKKNEALSTVPWADIFKSRAVWAIIVAHTCSNWGTYTFLTNIPTYMKEVLKFDIKQNGLYSAIPYIAFWIFINVAGVIADKLRARGVRTIVVRKIMLCCGTLLPAAFVIATGYIDCTTPGIAIALLTMGVGLSGFQYSGVMVNHVDIAPPFAGVLFGISNTVATLPGIAAPYAIGIITQNQTQAEWQTVFYISAAIYAVGAIFFVIFAAGETQDWAKPYMFEEEGGAEMIEGKDGALSNTKL